MQIVSAHPSAFHLEEPMGLPQLPHVCAAYKEDLGAVSFLCFPSASDQHQLPPHAAEVVVLGSLAGLTKGCSGIQAGAALLENLTLISA